MSQNQKLPTNQNLITLKDIRTRSKYWEKSEKEILKDGKLIKELNEDYRNLKIYTQWRHWPNNYKYLPVPDKFLQIKEDFLKNTWSDLENIPHYIIRNKNNQLTIIFQNRGQYDFANPRIVLFYGRNSFSEDTQQRSQKAKRKGEEYPTLYWITSWDYINNKSLLVQITARKCPIWAYYGDMMNSKGQANITTSQFNNEHLNKEGKIITNQKEHWPSDQDWNDQNSHTCPACDNCYDFCGDLRNKRAVPVGYNQPQIVKSWQPSFKLLYSYAPKVGVMASSDTSAVVITDDQGKPVIAVPTNLKLKELPTGGTIGNSLAGIMKNSSVPTLLFVVDGEHQTKQKPACVIPAADPRRLPTDKDGYLWEELPKCYQEEPHLLNHSSAQFYFQKKVLFTANLKHLLVRRKGSGWALGYRILIRSSIAGILYNFESGDIFYKWELKVKGFIMEQNFLNNLLGSVMSGFMERAGGALIKLGSKLPYVGGLISFFGGGDDKAKKKGNHLADIITPKKYHEFLGIELEGDQNKDQAENEQQTERQKKSTSKSQHRTVEPSIFYSNTIDFNYDFFEFANRCIANPFMIRFEHSEVLYNNLLNNNNKSPLQNIQCRFSAFKQCVKVGAWQGQIDLMFDIDNTLKNAVGAETYFYDDLDKLFQPWRPRYKQLQSFTHGDTFNSNTSPGQEDVDVSIKKNVGGTATGGDTVIPDDTAVYIYKDSYLRNDETGIDYLPDIMEMLSGHMKRTADSGCWYFWHDRNDTQHFTLPEGKYSYRIHGFNSSSNETDASFKHQEADTAIATLSGTNISIHVEINKEEIDYRFKYENIQGEKEKDYAGKEYKEPEWIDDNTQFRSNIGETDPEKLEKLTDFELEGKEKLTEEEKELKEKGGELEKDYEKELEKEKEKETEREKERQLERELEKEKEREREKEKELEKEKQRDQEIQTEKDKKDREAQWDKEKKETERKEREARARENERKRRERAQKDKDKKDKDKRERE